MLVKLILKIGVLAIELFLAFYSLVITDSLLVKFLFFAFSAIIVAFAVTKITNKLLPSDKDYISAEQELDSYHSKLYSNHTKIDEVEKADVFEERSATTGKSDG